MSWWEALLLGIVQGLTEFLPVSSSGHIELGKILLGIQLEEDLLFSVVVHFATALSTLVVFRNDIFALLREVFQWKYNEATRFVLFILVSMVPVFFLGVFFKKDIEQFFDGNLLLVGSMLLCTGGLLFLAFRLENVERAGGLNFPKAFLIGVAQAIAVLPGISRSGATISTALLLGVERTQAARFSFLMVIPPILGAALLELKDYWELSATQAVQTPLQPLVLGFLAAFVTGAFACQLMIRVVRKGKLSFFAVYCFLVGSAAVGYALFAA